MAGTVLQHYCQLCPRPCAVVGLPPSPSCLGDILQEWAHLSSCLPCENGKHSLEFGNRLFAYLASSCTLAPAFQKSHSGVQTWCLSDSKTREQALCKWEALATVPVHISSSAVPQMKKGRWSKKINLVKKKKRKKRNKKRRIITRLISAGSRWTSVRCFTQQTKERFISHQTCCAENLQSPCVQLPFMWCRPTRKS